MSDLTVSPKSVVCGAFRDVIEAVQFDLRSVEKYFSRNYVQCVDGKTLHYDEFVAHLRKQKDAISSAKVRFLSMVNEGDIVFTSHEVTAIKGDGKTVRFKVMAQFTVVQDLNAEQYWIVACDELTRMIEGESSDRDLGSRR